MAKGSVLFQQGDPGSSMCFIREGSITLYRSVSDGAHLIVLSHSIHHQAPDVPPVAFKYLGAGDSFGEMAILSNQPRSATAVASEATVILELRKSSFDRIMHEHQNLRSVKTNLSLDLTHLRFVVQEQYQERVEETQKVDTNIRSRSPSLARRQQSAPKLDI